MQFNQRTPSTGVFDLSDLPLSLLKSSTFIIDILSLKKSEQVIKEKFIMTKVSNVQNVQY